MTPPVEPALPGRVALVTGAARRVGAAIALGLARSGFELALHHHTTPPGPVAEAARALGRRVETFPADSASPGAAAAVVDAVRARFGRLDVVVNSAAAYERRPVEAIDDAAWAHMLAVNLTAPFQLVRAALPLLRVAPGGGSVVNVADISAERPWKGYAHYCASKGGLVTLTRALAVELAPEVRVNAVAPGTVDFPPEFGGPERAEARARIERAIPAGRVGAPEDVAAAVVFLVTGPAFITGVVLPVDGGRAASGGFGG